MIFKKNKISGFTLIELVISMTLLAILSRVIFPIIYWPSELYQVQNQHYDIENNVQTGFLMLEKVLANNFNSKDFILNHENGFKIEGHHKNINCDLKNKLISFENEQKVIPIMNNIKKCHIEFFEKKEGIISLLKFNVAIFYKSNEVFFEKIVAL